MPSNNSAGGRRAYPEVCYLAAAALAVAGIVSALGEGATPLGFLFLALSAGLLGFGLVLHSGDGGRSV